MGNCYPQISPPGLGKAHTADWFAVGVRQDLGTVENKGWQSMTYIGIGHKSNPDNYNPFSKSAILVLNQEFYNQFHNDWQYSLAVSYRRQDEYAESPPFKHDTPRIKQEFRLYGRLTYTLIKTSRIKLASTFRQEFRKFHIPNTINESEDFQLRSRFRLQLTANLNSKNTQRLITSAEQLFSISKENTYNTWTDFNYRESRFLLYYSYAPETLPYIFNVGYMNNLVGNKKPYDVHYLAVDIVIKNPFAS